LKVEGVQYKKVRFSFAPMSCHVRLVPSLQRGNAYHTGSCAGEWELDEKQYLQSINQV